MNYPISNIYKAAEDYSKEQAAQKAAQEALKKQSRDEKLMVLWAIFFEANDLEAMYDLQDLYPDFKPLST